MSTPLWLMGLWGPRDTAPPASNISGRGATPPDASFMFDVGRWETFTPWRARVGPSFSVTQTQWAATRRSPRNPIFSSHSTGLRPVFLRWLYTSVRVSERCVWSPTSSRSARAFAPAYDSSEQTYTPWRPTDRVTRSS